MLDSSCGGKTPTKLTLADANVSVSDILLELKSSDGGGFDMNSFVKRDGDYQHDVGGSWTKSNSTSSKCGTSCTDIEW